MTQEQRLTLALQTIGTDVKTIIGNQGQLSTLNTSAKSSLVSALNEIYSLISTAISIDDNASTGSNKTYSIDKIKSSIQSLKDDLLGGVPTTAFDTLKEIADYIGTDQTATSGLVTAIAKRVAVDSVQTFTANEKTQARENIEAFGSKEIGNPDTDLLAIYNTAKA